MSWTSAFPTFTEEMIEYFEENASPAERAELEEWFGEARVINPQPQARQIVSCSLFWKNAHNDDPDLPRLDRKLLKTASRQGLVRRYDPWSHYVEPILNTAQGLLAQRPELAIRVYLAADLDFLIKDLVKVGCEVRLMRSSSIRHNPGAMWRFLAFEDKNRVVTCCDIERLPMVGADLLRSEETQKAQLGFWRVPVWGDSSPEGTVPYRPIFGGQFGGAMRLPMRKLMMAMVWSARKGSVSDRCNIPGCGPRPIKGAIWPGYGFDEYFLLAAFYPRAARKGVLSFVPAQASSQLLLLDIEYVTWANPRSEVIYFGTPKCCTDPASPRFAPKMESGASADSTPFEGLMRLEEFDRLEVENLTKRHPIPRFAARLRTTSNDVNSSVWSWFNPASVEWRGRHWLAYRTECSPRWLWSRLNLACLDQSGRVIPGSNRLLSLATQYGVWGAEDPRFTVWQDRLLLTYNDGSRMGLAEIGEDGSVLWSRVFRNASFSLDAAKLGGRREKNWGLFGVGEELFVSYWVSPHVVYQCDEKKMRLGERWESPWSAPTGFGEIHGGSAPVAHDGWMWRVVHSRFPTPFADHVVDRYRLWLLAFEPKPPFRVRWFCKEPLVVGRPDGARHPEQVPSHVVFCGSLERREKGWRIYFGENDRWIRSGVIPDSLIEKRLEKVATV